jgi:hypothetical protein
MTDEQILHFAESMNYAHLHIDSTCYIGPGREGWEAMLPLFAQEWKAKLIAKIEHWRAIVEKERALP